MELGKLGILVWPCSAYFVEISDKVETSEIIVLSEIVKISEKV